MNKLAVLVMMGLATVIASSRPLDPVTACGMTVSAMAAMQQDPQDEPEGNPTHEEPTDYCRPVAANGKMPCMCLKQDPTGCRAGKRETEHRVCMSWCWKQWCKCCSS